MAEPRYGESTNSQTRQEALDRLGGRGETERRRAAVDELFALGWKWDGSAWQKPSPSGPVAIPDGWPWARVPCDPTPEMLAQFWQVCTGANWMAGPLPLTKRQLARATQAYRAMLAAAPVPSAHDVDGKVDDAMVERDAASEHARQQDERVLRLTEANEALIRERDELRAEIANLKDAGCEYRVTSHEGTSYCQLAESAVKRLTEERDELARRIAEAPMAIVGDEVAGSICGDFGHDGQRVYGREARRHKPR